MSKATISPPRIKYKSIALPASHGGWGFLLEPVLLGLLLVPSMAGLWLSLAALGAFLLQQPLKLIIGDFNRQRWYPRSTWAVRFAGLYGLAAVTAFGLAVFSARQRFWLPILLAAPLALAQFLYDVRNQGRALLPELAGAVALGSTASAIALAGGWSLSLALILWLILLARTLASVVYVRAKLRFERGEAVARMPVWFTHLVGIVAIGSVAYLSLAPWLAVIALLVLLIRAILGLLPHRQPVKARTVGFQEMGYGLLTVMLTVVGYSLDL